MAANTLPDIPRYCFAPVDDAEVGVQQIRILVEGMDTAIGTSLIVMTETDALALADKLNRPLGWRRESWTAFAAKYMRGDALD